MPKFLNWLRPSTTFWCIITVFLSAALIYGMFMGFGAMLALEDFKIKKKDMSFNMPEWISEEGMEKINGIALSNDKKNLFGKNLVEDIARAYKIYPFSKRVVSIKREFPDKVNIVFELRKPLAVVKSRGKRYLVDGDSVRLPWRYYKWPINNEHSVLIKAKKLKEIPPSGKAWKDKRILAGVDLVKFLKINKADTILDIESIDVSNVGKRYQSRISEIVLLTKGGTMIKWGGSSLYNKLDELSDEEKLRNLYSVAKVAGTDFADMEYVDVRWAKPVGKKLFSDNSY